MRSKAEESKNEDFEDREFLKGRDLSKQTTYARPNIPVGLMDSKDDIEFM